jgi:hypothetical protein
MLPHTMSNYIRLLLLTAILESATGLVLLAFPSLFLDLLLGIKDSQQASLIIARLAGAALVTISIFCYITSNHLFPAQRGIIFGLLFYNVAAAALLGYAGFGMSLSGLALWPAVTLHAFLALWCILCITSPSRQK